MNVCYLSLLRMTTFILNSVPCFQKVMFTATHLRILYNIRKLYSANLRLFLSKFKLNNFNKHSRERAEKHTCMARLNTQNVLCCKI